MATATLAASMAFCTGVAMMFPRRYYVNDNTGILEDIAGGFHANFFSALLGSMLHLGYQTTGSMVPCFGLFLYACLCVALFLTLWVAARLEIPLPARAILFGIILLLYLPFVSAPGYNAAAITLAGGSVLCCLVYAKQTERPSLWVCCLLGACLTVAAMVRGKAALGMLLFSGPVVIWSLLHYRRRMVAALVPFLLSAGIFVSADLAYERLAMGEVQQRFEVWQQLRGPFHAYPIANLNIDNKALLEANDWTKNDYLLLRDWLFLDESRFNLETMANVHRLGRTPVDEGAG